MRRPRLIHLTTTDISLELLLGPQLSAFIEAGYEVIGASAPGEFVEAIESRGVRHVPLANATRSMAPHRDLAALGELVVATCYLLELTIQLLDPGTELAPGLVGVLFNRAGTLLFICQFRRGLVESRLRDMDLLGQFVEHTALFRLEFQAVPLLLVVPGLPLGFPRILQRLRRFIGLAL